jgi:hypothetical protein
VKLPAIAPATLDIEIAWLKAHYWKEGTALEKEREPLPVLAALKQDMPLPPLRGPGREIAPRLARCVLRGASRFHHGLLEPVERVGIRAGAAVPDVILIRRSGETQSAS